MTGAPISEALLQKMVSMERCIVRAREERDKAPDLAGDATRYDAAVLNVLRACELAIDIAHMIIAHEAWPLPATAADAFTELRERGRVDADMADVLRRMVGFRNVAVHAYARLDPLIVAAVIDHELDLLARFAGRCYVFYQP